ncbi:PEP-CTERM sorting domain-containing protein [Alkalimonas mucilaginosa]|uniref:PEP-CTERM sorting domain-containing protein n=1 Tax=Alkalimonas mucilaginosa TaxID=3057676 RepID=A0ABU7JBS8_9GAMM|nr:PEP-CTERM sorting domain-containing protein [Alkalimonas sp. MEB004]MEE2022940.1 PEP-CTERM sorting domain-containing protein [Alkalimonas sp. MEB004]
MKKLLLAVLLFGFASLFSQPSAYATPILSQDILLNNNGTIQSIGFVSVNVADSFEWGAPTYAADSWLELELFGFQFMQSFGDTFEALFDINNLVAGFEFLQFDVLDPVSGFAFQGIFDTVLGFGFLDVFSVPDESLIAAFDTVFLGNTSVAVPVPATFGLMLLALFGLALRRRA